MAKVIEITEKKINKLSNLVEDMLLAGGELMHCISKMEDEFYGERRSDGGSYYGNRYGNRMPMHDEDDWDESEEMRRMIGERRRRRGMRY